MGTFKHYIITRFNLPKRWNADKKGNTVLDNLWLKERFELFEKFCLPSIKAQTSQNFEWWVYFDRNTESSFIEKINSIEREYVNFKARYEESYDDFEANMPREIHCELDKNNMEWVITTRLDNDDMLAGNTLELIQKKFDFRNTLLEIPAGYTLELSQASKLRRVSGKLNSFISYAEKINREEVIKTVYHHQHTDWQGVESAIVTSRPQWVQIIHDKNVFNRIAGELVLPIGFKSRFNFDSSALKMNLSYRLVTNVVKNKLQKFKKG